MRRDHPLVCLVTSRHRLSPGGGDFRRDRVSLLELTRAAVDAGVDIIQVRERDVDASRLVDLVGGVLDVAHGSPTEVVVNDRLDVALACGAAGVHLRADSISPLAVRSITEPGFLVGRSVHDVGEAVQYAVGVDYLIAGTVFPTTGKRDVPRLLGTSGLADITRAVRVPVLAIGGVTLQNLPQIAAAGASGIAAIGLFLDPSSIVGVVTAVRSQFDIAGAPS